MKPLSILDKVELKDVDAIRVPRAPAAYVHACYKLYGYIKFEALVPGTTRDGLLRQFCQLGVRAYSGVCPEIYLEAAFADLDVPRRLTAAELGCTSVMFEVHPTLDPATVRRAAETVASVLHNLKR